MSGFEVIEGDCVAVFAQMAEASVDAIVCDPPYGLGFMGKDWDSSFEAADMPMRRSGAQDAVNAGAARQGGRQRAGADYQRRMARDSRTFQAWCEAWAVEALRVLKPGGHLLAFGGTRTYHRLAAGIEDAGFEVRDCLAWLYGSGFPKSLDVSKAIDGYDAPIAQTKSALEFTAWLRSTGVTGREINAATGTFMGGHYLTAASQPQIPTAEHWALIRPLVRGEIPAWVDEMIGKRAVSENLARREVIGERDVTELVYAPGTVSEAERRRIAETAPHTDEARDWHGWGTALKPAHEPIVMARKPLAGTVARNVLAHGTGALNVDGCRVPMSDEDRERIDSMGGFGRADYEVKQPGVSLQGSVDGTLRPTDSAAHNAGRWPANVVLDERAAEMLDAQTGEMKSPSPYARSVGTDTAIYGDGLGRVGAGAVDVNYGDSGGASRFLYVAKASSAERSAGLDNYARDGKTCVCPVPKDPEASPPRATSEPTEADAPDSSTTGNGNSTTDPSPPASRSTTATATRPTTGSGTSNSSAPSITSGRTPPTTGAAPMASGSDGAACAANGSPPTPSTTTSAAKAGPSMADADPATSGSSSSENSSARATCPDCGGVIEGGRRNVHPLGPTVKPIELMRWLVRLVTPPGGTVVDPFTGSGTTGCAAMLEGFGFLGIERDPEYAKIARARIEWWSQHPEGVELVRALEADRERRRVAESGQIDLFAALDGEA